jgi:polysaccharide biosynthesis/export protein
MHKRQGTWLFLAFLVLAIPAGAQEATATKPPSQPAVPAVSGVQKAATSTDPNYVIGAQDVLDISVWKEPEVSRVVPVRPDGRISLPLLNDVQAAGLTPAALAAQLTENLKKYVTNPQVTVIVTAINSQRVYLLGEVTRPGAFPMIPGMTVLQAISSGGGFTQYARIKAIYVLRNENGKQVKYPFNYKEVVGGKKPEQDIPLKAGDTVVVP